MNEKQILMISIQAAALLFLIYMLQSASMIFSMLQPEPITGGWQGLLVNPYTYPTLALYIAPVLIWFFPESILPGDVRETEPQNEDIDKSGSFDLRYTLFSTLGVYVLAKGLASFSFRLSQPNLWGWIVVITVLFIAIFLVVHPKQILVLIRHLRTINTCK